MWTGPGGKGKEIRYLYHDFLVLFFWVWDEFEDYETWLGFGWGVARHGKATARGAAALLAG
jgi:hypothetical protein